MKKSIIAIALCAAAAAGVARAATDPVPRDTSFTLWGTYVKQLKKHPEITIPADTLIAGTREWRDVPYAAVEDSPYGDRRLRCDIFRPDDTIPRPAVIMIHGGGWNSGDKSLQRPMARRLAAAGFVAIPVEYRLIPEALYPAGLHDVKTAVRWARAHAADYGIDTAAIALSGCSAGAQLATLAGVTNGSAAHDDPRGQWQPHSSDVRGIINFDGIATFISDENLADVRERIAKKGTLPVNAMWLGGVYDEATAAMVQCPGGTAVTTANWEHASSLRWITAASAPVCFISSELARYSDGRDLLCERYAALGILAERHRVGAGFHPFWLFDPYLDRALAPAVAFLRRLFPSAAPAK